MRKDEFLRRLEMLLSDISAEEREEAMAFYRSYFEDAGEGNEAQIIAELESPENVAEIIKRDLGMVTVTEQEQQSNPYGNYEDSKQAEKERNDHHNLVVALVVIIAIITAPVWFGILSGVLGTVIGLSAALIAVTAAMFVIGVVFVGLGITMLAGLAASVVSVPAGLAFVGAGLIVLAVAVLLVLACGAVFGKFFPWAFKGIYQLCKKPFEKKEA